MNNAFRFDRTIYVLMGFVLISNLMMAGCSTNEPQATNTPAELFQNQPAPESLAMSPQAGSQPATTLASASIYVDGTYSSSASYETPAGSESIQVSLAVKGDVVTGLTVTSLAKDATSKIYQGLFISGINAQVVGKSLASLSGFGPVNGSSLTPIGFQAAVASIKGQAF